MITDSKIARLAQEGFITIVDEKGETWAVESDHLAAMPAHKRARLTVIKPGLPVKH